MNYKLIIFDFDGTLADSFPFLISVFNQLADQYGFKKVQAEEIPALRQYDARTMMKYSGLPLWKLPFVANKFISLMDNNIKSIRLFEGVDDLLRNLSRSEVKMAVVTSNSFDNVKNVLGRENIRLISSFECGMSIFGKKSRLLNVIKQLKIPQDETIYIGDQITDLKAAREATIHFGAVSWGYGTIESLKEHKPEMIFYKIDEINALV